MFAPGSPRQVTPETVARDPPPPARRASITVGVFRDERPGAGRRDRQHARPRRRAAPRPRAAVRRPVGPPAGAVRDPGVRRRRPRARRGRPTARSTSCWSTPTSPGRARLFDWALADARARRGAAAARRRAAPEQRRRRRSGGSGRGASTCRAGSRPRRARAARTPRKLRRFIERRRGRGAARRARRRRRAGVPDSDERRPPVRLDGRRCGLTSGRPRCAA